MDLSNSGFLEWDDFWSSYAGNKNNSPAKKRIIKILDSLVRPGMDVLDAGCGTGFFSSYFISRGCNVYSMDYSEKALSIAKTVTKNDSMAYIKADILDSGILAGFDVRFDIVFTDGLFEHYTKEKQDLIVSNIKKLKKEQGCLVSFVPNKYSLWSMIRPFVMSIEEKPFIMSGFMDLHKRNGLNVVVSGGISVLPFRISPERLLGRYFGMLFYCISR